jgi:hypothetical protein
MNVDLSGHFDMIKEYSHYSTTDVMAYMAWVMGDPSSAVRKKHDDPKKHMMYPLDTTLTGNPGKVALFKVQMRQVAQVLYYALKNAMTEEAYKSFSLQEKKFMYFDAETQDIIWDGFTFLSLVLDVIKPDTVVQVKTLETQFKAITLASCKGCFRTLVTTLENKAAEINEVAGEVRISNNMLLTQIFETAEKAPNEAFKMDLTIAKSSWVTGKQTDKDVIIADLTKLYVNKQDEGTWKTGSEKDAKIIALTTQVENVKKSLNALKSVHFKQGTPPPAPASPRLGKQLRLMPGSLNSRERPRRSAARSLSGARIMDRACICLHPMTTPPGRRGRPRRRKLGKLVARSAIRRAPLTKPRQPALPRRPTSLPSARICVLPSSLASICLLAKRTRSSTRRTTSR